MIFKIISGIQFDILGHCDLDIWPIGPKSTRGHLLVMSNHFVKHKNLIVFKKLSGNYIDIQGHCSLDFWLVTTNLHVKYEDFVINGFQYIFNIISGNIFDI